MQIRVIAKPARDGTAGSLLEESTSRLRAWGHDVQVQETGTAGDAERFARAAVAAGADLVLAVGGDGTINGVVNGLAEGARPPRLGILPTGTANDFARGLGLPRDAAAALHTAVYGRASRMDVARVNGRHFINVSTGGFGVEATRAAPQGAKRLLGPLAYGIAAARRLVQFRESRAAFEVEGRGLYEGPFAFFAVGNSWRTGGGARVTPRAERTDGALDVLIVGEVSRFDLLTLLPDLRAGTHLESPSVLYVRTRSLRVQAREPLRVNADGEPISAATLSYDVLAGRLEVMTPA